MVYISWSENTRYLYKIWMIVLLPVIQAPPPFQKKYNHNKMHSFKNIYVKFISIKTHKLYKLETKLDTTICPSVFINAFWTLRDRIANNIVTSLYRRERVILMIDSGQYFNNTNVGILSYSFGKKYHTSIQNGRYMYAVHMCLFETC